MDASETNYPPGDPRLIDKIVYQLKSQGIFDQFRKECMADVDTKPAYQNLHQRVEASVSTFLAGVEWRPDLSKNQLRENLRKHINESGFLEIGVERIVDQVVNPKIRTVFLPHVEEVVYSFLGLERPRQARPVTNISALKPQVNDPPPVADSKLPEPKKVAALSDLLPQDLDPVSPESDTCELILKNEDDTVGMEYSDGEAYPKDKKPEEDTSPAFEPLLDENSNGSHISGMSGFSSHEEGQLSPMHAGVSRTTVVQDAARPDLVEKMDVEASCKSESESGADKVSSTVEESMPSPADTLTHNMSALDIQELGASSNRLMDAKDEKCDSSMDSMRIERDKDADKEKDSRRKEKSDSKSSKSRSDSKDKYKSSDKPKHDSKDKKTEKEKSKHEEKSRTKSETRKEKESGSKKDKVSEGKKDKASEVKKDKKAESSKSEHRDGGSKKDKDTGSRKEKDSDKKHDKDGDKKKSSDRDKSKSDDRSKLKHDDKSKNRNKGDAKHGKEGKDKSQNNKDDKNVKSTEKKSNKSTSDQKSKDGEKKDKEKSSSSSHKHSGDQKSFLDSEKNYKDKKVKTSDHTTHGDDKLSTDGDQKSKDKSKKGRDRAKTPDDVQSTDGESDARSRDGYKKGKDGTEKRLDDQASTDGESDHRSRDNDKRSRRSRHKPSDKKHGNDDRSENGDGESSSTKDDRKRKERRSKGAQDDHHQHHGRRDHDRRSADRDSSGSAPPSGGSGAPRQGRSGRQESSPRKSSKASDTNGSATDAMEEDMQLHLRYSSDSQDDESSLNSSLPFKKRVLLQATELENNVNRNSRTRDKTVSSPCDPPGKAVSGLEEVNPAVVPKPVEKQKLGEIEKSLRSEVDASLATSVPSFDGKMNGMLRVRGDDEESDILYFKSCDDSIFDDRDRQYVKALKMLKDNDFTFTKSNDDELTVCPVSQCFDDVVKTAEELGIRVVKTLQGIEVYCMREEQESGNALKDMLKNRRYVVRLSDDVKVNSLQMEPEVVDLESSNDTSLTAELTGTDAEYTALNSSPDDHNAYRSASDEDLSYDVPLSSDLILPSLQDLMRESGMLPATNTSTQMGACRRVGLPRPTTRKSDSGASSGAACLDKKNGMSSDKHVLRSGGESKRYSSDDLYKPRPLFSHGSRRNRHNSEEQAVDEVQRYGVKRSISEDSSYTSPVAKKRR